MDYDFDIYIAGPMTGRPLFNHPAFNAAEAKYAALGYRVFNPAKNGLPPESPWREHMRVDIAALLRSRSVVLLDGWMDSRGANIEHDIAAAVGAPLFLDRIVAEDDLRSILGEPLAPQQTAPIPPQKPELAAVQAGWALVPLEPTDEMLEAAVQAICYGPGGGFTRISGPHRCWSAMLTAAPKAPQQAAPAQEGGEA